MSDETPKVDGRGKSPGSLANLRPANTNWREDLPATPPPEVSA